MRRNRLKVSSIWIRKKTRSEILNYYHSVDNITWLFDKPNFSNNQIIGFPSLFSAITSLRINTAKKEKYL